MGTALWPAGAGAQTITLRLAASVPANSPWDLGLRSLAAGFDRVSGGRVRLGFVPSAKTATQTDIIQRMRLGVDGALLTTNGLAALYPDSLALSMPGLIESDREFDAVLAAVKPLIESRLADRFVLLALSKGGWVRYFSRTPIVYPADLSKVRISLGADYEKEIRLMQSLGARVVTGSLSDFLLQINSNAVDAICVSPIYVATLWSQLRGKIAYMSSFKAAPFLGAIIFNRSSWARIPADLRPPLEELVRREAGKIGLESARLETEAIASLDGIKVPPEPSDVAAAWSEAVAQRQEDLISKMFSADFLDAMDAALAKFRTEK